VKIKYEYRAYLLRHGEPQLMPAQAAQGIVGFSSVYGFPEETVRCIEDSGSTRDIHGLPLYSDLLYLDFDSEEGVEEARQKLQHMGIGYERYTTGNRGCHFHIPIEAMLGPLVPSIQKAYVDQTFPYADLSLYKYTGIIRNNGTWNLKNLGRRKELIEVVEGKKLVVDLTPPRNRGETRMFYSELDPEEADIILGQKLLQTIGNGGRNNGVYMLAYMAKTAKYNKDEARDLLWQYNCTMVQPPLDDREFNAIINSCFR
jgi:hypothetical protein